MIFVIYGFILSTFSILNSGKWLHALSITVPKETVRTIRKN